MAAMDNDSLETLHRAKVDLMALGDKVSEYPADGNPPLPGTWDFLSREKHPRIWASAVGLAEAHYRYTPQEITDGDHNPIPA
tara:strand:- start:183 stop:428 length:246 start_codon:yes stop_codon:yes gene_type:complete